MWLQDDFVPLEEEDSSSDESFMSFEFNYSVKYSF